MGIAGNPVAKGCDMVRRLTLRLRNFRGLLQFWLDNPVPSYTVQSGPHQILSKIWMQTLLHIAYQNTINMLLTLHSALHCNWILWSRTFFCWHPKDTASWPSNLGPRQKKQLIIWKRAMNKLGFVELQSRFIWGFCFLGSEDCLGVNRKDTLKINVLIYKYLQNIP